MKIQITSADETTETELQPGRTSLGGGVDDSIRIEGLPPAVLSLSIEGDRLVVESAQTLPIGGVLCPANLPRVLLAEEAVELPLGVLVRRSGTAGDVPAGTVAMLKELLTDVPPPVPTRTGALTCLTGLDMGRVYSLADGTNDIGRSEEVRVRIRDRAVSRKHARLKKKGIACILEDLDSPNGVFVNGSPLNDKRPLSHGDIIELGRTLLRFTAPEVPPLLQSELDARAEEDKAPVAKDAPPVEIPPVAQAEPKAEDDPLRRQRRLDWLLIALGALLALLGAFLSYRLAKS